MAFKLSFAPLACLCWASMYAAMAIAAEPLPSWQSSEAKQSIVRYVSEVTQADGPHYLPPASRIAVFDNDGTLWCEQPMYVQLAFVLDRIQELAPQHPEWAMQEPFRSAINRDLKALGAAGEKGLMQLVMATHTGMTTTEFEQIVTEWIQRAQHPRFARPYTQCVYQPMLELLEYLKTNEFKIYIVSGGGVEFMRPWAEQVYGVPRDRVIGSSVKTEFQVRDGKPVLVRLPALNFIDDKAGKPVAIHEFIGQRPVMAVGNSDGDLQMLQYTTAGEGPRLGVIIHHTDEVREYAYDRKSAMGKLDQALDQAAANHWTVVDTKDDWSQVFSAAPVP